MNKHILPAELLFNRRLNIRLDFVKPTLSNAITSLEDHFCRIHYESNSLCQLNPGEKV